jgi:uncharacterized membrane protein
MGEVTISASAGIYGSMQGAAIGASWGSFVPVVGTIIGGFVGAVVGGIAGSSAGEFIAKGVRKVREVAVSGLKKVYEGSKAVAKGLLHTCTFGIFA